ncbi:MAG: hypothetical protein M1837_002861 [Sclerophora amabilis]|nr:MAG: hypothetical protein M1837_002861 [Sclerophora amabilis]
MKSFAILSFISLLFTAALAAPLSDQAKRGVLSVNENNPVMAPQGTPQRFDSENAKAGA